MVAAAPEERSMFPDVTGVRLGEVKVRVRGPAVPPIANWVKVACPLEDVLTVLVPVRPPPPVARATVTGTFACATAPP
jgi:hypothetical protein